MAENSVRDARIAVAIISTVGTLAIIVLWGAGTFTTFLNLMNFSSSTAGEYVFGFMLVRLPMVLAILGGGIAFVDLRHSSWILGLSAILWLLFTLLWWAADGSNPPTSGVFGTVFLGVSAYLSFKAHSAEAEMVARQRIRNAEASDDEPAE